MAVDLLDIAVKFAVPVFSGLGTGAFVVLRYKKKVDDHDEGITKLRTQAAEDKATFDKRLLDMAAAFDRKEDKLREEIEKNNKELLGKVEEVDNAFKRFERASSHDFAKDAEFGNFVAEQQQLWQQVQRALGQIEGMLKKRWSSPPPALSSPSAIQVRPMTQSRPSRTSR
jgi:hypothetical protein